MSAVKTIAKHTGFSESDLMLWAGLGILGFVIYKGGLAKALASLTSTAAQAAVNAAGGAVTGTVTGVSEVVGLPTPEQTTTDPYVARYIIDDPRGGYYAASKWASAPALVAAIGMPAGSGHEPPQGSAVAHAFPPYIDLAGSGGIFD